MSKKTTKRVRTADGRVNHYYGRKPTDGELAAESWGRTCHLIAQCVRYLATATGVVLPFWFAQQMVSSLAHGETKVAFDVGNTIGFSVSVMFNFVLWGSNRAMKRAHKNTIERLSSRPKELEIVIDKNRSSSKLTQRGETPAENR
jgi:hypothetical protein